MQTHAQEGQQSQFMHLHHKLHVQGHIRRPLVDSPSPNHMINPSWNMHSSQPQGARQQHHQLEQRHERTSHFGAAGVAQQQLSRSYDGFSAGMQHQHVSSQVRLRFQQEDKKRASTLDARGGFGSGEFDPSYNHHARGKQPELSPRQRWRQKSAELAAQQNTGMLPVFSSNDRIEEEIGEQSCSSRPSQAQVSSQLTSLPQELLQQLDFAFFKNVYSAYNTIWQQVMKLQIYGQNFVKRDDFVRVLRACKVLGKDNGNVFCNFLLFSCASHLKSSLKSSSEDQKKQPLLLLDFRFFLKSVFMTLKRQFNDDDMTTRDGAKTIDSQDQERIFHAEMFLVDHFWEYVCQTEPSLTQNHDQSKDSGSAMNKSIIDGPSERNSANSFPMELLQKKIFEFFDRRQPPFLLQIHDIEYLVTECFKNLIERKKRKDKISKRTFKKVVSRQCPGILARAFAAFIPGANDPKKPTQRLTPFSLPMSDSNTARTGLNASGNQYKSYGKVVDHYLLQPRSMPRTTEKTNMSMTGNSYETKKNIQTANRDQKSIEHTVDQQTEQQPEKQIKSQPIARAERRNLCKQLETKIVVKKLQSVLNSFNIRQAFITLYSDPYPLIEVRGDISADICPESPSEDTAEKPPLLIRERGDTYTRSSEKLEMPVDQSQRRSTHSTEKFIIPVQQLNKNNHRERKQKRHGTFSNQFSNVMTAPHSHLSMAQVCQSKDACNCCSQTQNEVGSVHHLQSYHQNQNRILSLGGPQSMVDSGHQVLSIDSNYRTSCFQEADQKGQRQVQVLPESLQSNQKLLPNDLFVVSDSSSAREIQQQQQCQQQMASARSGNSSAVDMLKHILQHETQNQQCLQELVARIQQLEMMNSKQNSRDQTFQQVQNLRFLRQDPTFSLNSTHLTTAQQMQHGPGTFQHVVMDSTGDIEEGQERTSGGANSCIGPNCFCRQSQQYEPSIIDQSQPVGLQDQQQLSSDSQRIMQAQHQMLGGLKTSSSQNVTGSYHHSQSISQRQSQDVDLCGSMAEGYCHQQFYEVSQDEQRMRLDPAYDNYGDEMDFEANKEQRPLQIVAQLQEIASMPELSGVSDFTDSTNLARNAPSKGTTTISDAYVNSTQMPSLIGANEYNPYLMTTNSNGQSTAARYRFAAGMKPVSFNQQSKDKIGVINNAASLSYTISDSKIADSHSSKNQVTSAPHLQVISAVLPSQKMPEQPYSNRIQDGEEQKYDPLNYLMRSDSAIEEPHITEQEQPENEIETNNLTTLQGELVFQRKYKKMKKHVKSMIQEKRELEGRVEHAIRDTQILQNHLEKTAQSAQEVSNHNEELQHELRMRKLFFAIRTFVRVRELHSQSTKNERMRRAFLRWVLQSEKIGFYSEQTQHQELILSELSRHEHDFKHQIGHYERRIDMQSARARVTFLKQLLRSRGRMARVRAFEQWKAVCSTSTRRTVNKTNDLKQDLTQVVTQLNQFRIQLVLTKLRAALKRSLTGNLGLGFSQINQFPGYAAKTPNRPPRKAVTQYKSPFMQHLASQNSTLGVRNQQTEYTNDSICTMVSNHHDQSIISRPNQDQHNMKMQEQFKRRSIQSLEAPLPPRSQSTGMGKPGLIYPKQQQQMMIQQETSDASIMLNGTEQDYESVRPMAPRQKLNLNQRSHSEGKPSKKEQFKMRMDNKMHNMRKQGQHVDGLVKLHGFFSRVKKREEMSARHIAFTVLLNNSLIVRREAHKENIRRTFQERQVFAMTSKPPRMVVQSLPSRVASATNISYSSSAELSMRGPKPNLNATPSGSSLQLGSQLFKGETPISSKQGGQYQTHQQQMMVQSYNPEQPKSRPPPLTTQNLTRNDYPNLMQLRESSKNSMRHQRSESENTLEPPRIMMNMSPSMHNIGGPDLMKSQKSSSVQQFDYDMNMRRRSIPPRPKSRWQP